MARQKMLPKAIQKKLPALYANENKTPEEIKVPLKLFNPMGPQTWYITELDPATNRAFGYMTGMGFDELGYIDLNELQAIRLPYGMYIERDIYWDTETTLAQVMRGERR